MPRYPDRESNSAADIMDKRILDLCHGGVTQGMIPDAKNECRIVGPCEALHDAQRSTALSLHSSETVRVDKLDMSRNILFIINSLGAQTSSHASLSRPKRQKGREEERKKKHREKHKKRLNKGKKKKHSERSEKKL